MSVSTAIGIVVNGVRGELVRVEVAVSDGLPSIGIVGLPDASVSEAKSRARCAVDSSGRSWPNRKITVSLSPAEVRKHGAGLDLPLAVGVLAADGQLPREALQRTAFLGELGLGGQLYRAQGTLAAVLAARAGGLSRVVVSDDVAAEIQGVPDLEICGAGSLSDVCRLLSGDVSDDTEALRAPRAAAADVSARPPSPSVGDLSDVRGQRTARWALEVAAAGGHHMAMIGSPGVGKTLLATRLPGLLPELCDDDALDVAAIHSVSGLSTFRPGERRPPLQSPHHSASAAALLGSVHAGRVVPGAVTLAHRGVLFLDEAPEFCRPALEGLRQPLETGTIALHRSGWQGTLPASFQLIIAANPCPCGMRMARGGCSCAPPAIQRYAARLSGPLMDRIDIRLTVQRPADGELHSTAVPESSSVVQQRVTEARERCRRRLQGTPWGANAEIPTGQLRGRMLPDAEGAQALQEAERRAMNLRGVDRVLRMAWTVADLAGRERPGRDEVEAALTLRGAQTSWV